MDRFLHLQRLMFAANVLGTRSFRKGLAGFSALMCAFALGVGCGGSTGEGEECEGDQCPALPGGRCKVDGVTFESGATGIPAPDGCNSCSCHEGELACTLLGCEPPQGPVTCTSDARCGALEYCAFAVGACGLTAKLLAPDPGADRAVPIGQCQSRPDACTEDYTPVCGCNGVTYANACAAAHAGVNLRARDACPAN
jgi:Kazal-type serine protease inhibitor domain